METKLFEMIEGHLKADEQVRGEGNSRIGDKVFRLFERAGVTNEVVKLPEDRFDIVAHGVVALWKIDVMGRRVEKMDEEKIKGSEKSSESVNDVVRKQVKSELEVIGRSYHGFNEWLPESVRQLVGAALEKDPKKMYLHKEGIMFSPDHYITRLRNAGRFYQNVISGVYPPEESAPMDIYIKNEREESLHQMRSIFNGRLGGVVAALQPLPQEGKK